MSSFENFDSPLTQMVSATGKASLGSTLQQVSVRRVAPGIETKDQQDFPHSVLIKPAPLTVLDTYERFITSAVFGLDNLKQLAPVSIYEISRDAEDFIAKQKKSFQLRKDIIAISDKASEFLSKEGIKAKISISLFKDPEYDEWVEPKIRIDVPTSELIRTYGLYNQLLSYSLREIHKKTLKRLFVTIESR